VRVAAAVLFASLWCTQACGAGDYALRPSAVADGIYVLVGRVENFSRENGGNIANTGFIVGGDGVIVIDSGPSRSYAEQQRAAIASVTLLPVARVFITHAHPDHFLGDQVYPPELIAALPATIGAIRANGDALADNLYRLVGGWMSGTTVVVPGSEALAGRVVVAGRPLRLFAASGHTDGDLMVYDEKTRTLFAGDLVFSGRAATTPNADLPRWLAALDEIDRLDFAVLVPGHGPVAHDHAAVAETRDYLRWLDATLREAASRGLDMNEVMSIPLPERFKSLAAVDAEYARSIAHLYPRIELEHLPALTVGR
jgi:quinoprotein relay system zinc metallohydrolase 1